MTEDEARTWVLDAFGADGLSRMERLVERVVGETARQNLIAPSTLQAVWTRHIVDSAQLIDHARGNGSWLDIGTGAGFPGIVVALLTGRKVCLVEPRRRRAGFLHELIEEFGISARTYVVCARVETIEYHASVISARAVSTLCDVFASAVHCVTPETTWLLPKGRHAQEEVATARRSWQGVFHVEQSITDANSLIVLASGIKRREKSQ